jgi:hypothetical protein
LAGLAHSRCSRRRTSPTWPAKFFSTCSRQTNLHGQSLFGHFSRRANCFRLSLTNRFSLSNSASSLVVERCLPLIMSTSEFYTNLFRSTCHLNPVKFSPGPGAESGLKNPLISTGRLFRRTAAVRAATGSKVLGSATFCRIDV